MDLEELPGGLGEISPHRFVKSLVLVGGDAFNSLGIQHPL
jgi:hypothetical protein